jgi:small multidrug resistance pump
MIGWAYLLIAIATEVAGTVALRASDGFSRLWPSVGVVVGYGLSFVFLALTLRHLELSLAYAVWAGLGTAAIALIGIFFLDEGSDFLKLASIALIVVGVVGLNLAEAE